MIIMGNMDKNITRNMGNWEFNEEVSQVFDEMLSRSIPSYNRMRYLVTQIVVEHIRKNNLTHNTILDLGCSTGEQISVLNKHLKSNEYVGLECSEPMLKEARKKNKGELNVHILNFDLTKDELEIRNCGAILSILTLQFIPIEYRQKIMNTIYNHLNKNGVFIFVEKIIGDNYNFSALYEKLYYDMKYMNGYSLDEIRDKKLKLEGVLVPVTNQFNLDLMRQAGFTKIDVFWRDLNFIGYIAMK